MSVVLEQSATEGVRMESAHPEPGQPNDLDRSKRPSQVAGPSESKAPTVLSTEAKRRGETAPVPVDVPVTVDIYDQTYHLHGQDPAYIDKLAAIVDCKMRAVAAGGTTVDSLRVAVLAALNIADQLMRTEARYRALSGSIVETESTLRNRAASLSGLLDSILSEDRKAS